MPKKKTTKPRKKAQKKVLKYEVGDKVYFRQANGEWGFGWIEWITRNFKGNKYFVGKTKYADAVFGEDYLFTEKEYKKLAGVKDD